MTEPPDAAPSNPGQPYPGQPYPGQPYPGQPYPGQPPPYHPSSPYPSQPVAYPGQPGSPWYLSSAPPARRYSRWAIAALITGLVPILGIFAALPLGVVAIVKIASSHERGRWMAILGIVVSGLWWVGLLALGFWVQSQQAQRDDAGVIIASGDLSFGDVRAGDCVQINGLRDRGTTEDSDFEGVPCADPHNARALYVVQFPQSDYPGQAVVRDQALAACRPRYAAERIPPVDQFLLFPFESRWEQDDGHRAICFAINDG